MRITVKNYNDEAKKINNNARDKGHDFDYIEQRIGCPVRFKQATPSSLKKEIVSLLEKGIYTFYMHGGVGTGKTYSAYAIGKLFFVNQIGVEICNIVDTLNKIKNTFSSNDSDRYINELFFSKEVFILDDLGAEKVTDWSYDIIYRLINTRYERMMPLIITSNFDIDKLSNIYGDRIASRLVEMMDKNIIKFTGKDRRLGC